MKKNILYFIALTAICSLSEANPQNKANIKYQEALKNGISTGIETGMTGAAAGIMGGVKGIAALFGIKEETRYLEETRHLNECKNRPGNYGPNCKKNRIERIH